MAFATILLEGWLAIGLWLPRTRAVTATIGVLFHLVLVVTLTTDPLRGLQLIIFGAATLLLYVPFFVRDRGSDDACDASRTSTQKSTVA